MDDGKRWGRGLLLCATGVAFRHPVLLEKVHSPLLLLQNDNGDDDGDEQHAMVRASIPVPHKFEAFLAAERNKFHYSSINSDEVRGYDS